MKTDLFVYLPVSLFVVMHNLISGNQICSKLEFVQGSDKTVAVEGSLVNLTFYLDTKQCLTNKTRYSIKVSRENNGRHTDICTFILANTCIVSAHSIGCYCLAPLGPMLFSKNVTSEDNNTVYVWKWGDFSPEEERRITFETATSSGGKTDRVKGTESKTDNSMVVIISTSTGVCLVVITAVVITFVACCRRVSGRWLAEPRVRLEGNKVIIVSDQARETYEEIEDAPKPHGRCRVSLKSGVSLPPIPVSHLYVETPCSAPGIEREIQDKSVEYLHPLEVARTESEETAEYRVVSCAQSLAMWRPRTNSM